MDGKVYPVMEETATKNALMDQAFTYPLLHALLTRFSSSSFILLSDFIQLI
jgi:hypothetical protein